LVSAFLGVFLLDGLLNVVALEQSLNTEAGGCSAATSHTRLDAWDSNSGCTNADYCNALG
jgi:hypothetical protein